MMKIVRYVEDEWRRVSLFMLSSSLHKAVFLHTRMFPQKLPRRHSSSPKLFLISEHVCWRMKGTFWEMITVLLSLERILKEESEPIFRAVQSGTHYDSFRVEMLRMMSESDMRASVRCHGDAQPNGAELREQRWKWNEGEVRTAPSYCHVKTPAL